MLTAYCWNTATNTGDWLSPEKLQAEGARWSSGSYVLWLDLENPGEEEESLAFDSFFRVHSLTREDIIRPKREPETRPHFPKVEEFPDYLFVIVNPLTQAFLQSVKGQGERVLDIELRSTTQLSVILTETILITHHYETMPSIAELRSFLAKHQLQAGRGPDYLFHLILDAMVDEYAVVLDGFDESLDSIEERIFQRLQPGLLQDILRLKREMAMLRKTLVYEREVLARLSRNEFDLINERETVYYRNVYDHLVRFSELIEGAREMISDLKLPRNGDGSDANPLGRHVQPAQ